MESSNSNSVFSTICEKCGRTLYEGEMLNINGKYVCESCAERCVFGDFGASPPRKRRAVSPFWNFIFSLHPGAGQMFQGFMKRGLFQMLLFYGCIFLCTATPTFFGLMIPIICIYSFFDSLSLRRRVADGEDIADELGGVADFLARNKGVVLLVLIVLMVFGLISSLIGYGVFNRHQASVQSYVTEVTESAVDGTNQAYSRTTVYAPQTFIPVKTLSPLFLICIGGIIMVKTGKRGRHTKHDKRREHDIYDSND